MYQEDGHRRKERKERSNYNSSNPLVSMSRRLQGLWHSTIMLNAVFDMFDIYWYFWLLFLLLDLLLLIPAHWCLNIFLQLNVTADCLFFFPSPMLVFWHFKFLFFFNILYSRLLMCLKHLFFDVMICDCVFHRWGESAWRRCHTQTERQCDAFAIFLSVPQLSFFSGFVSETITAGSILCFFSPRDLQCDLSKSTFLNRNTLSELFIVLKLLVTSFKREKSVTRCLSRDSSCLFWAYASDSPGL